jgi:hypothetical protein
MMTTQKEYKSNKPWTQYICDYQECQDKLIKATLRNFWQSRGMKAKAEKIHVDKDLDHNEEKVKSLLSTNSDNTEARIMAKVEARFKTMVTKEKMHEHYNGFKAFEQSVDHKLNIIHNSLKEEMDKMKLENPIQLEDTVDREEILRLIEESRVSVLTTAKAMDTKRFPKGYDHELEEIASKIGNLTKIEIQKARAAIFKFGSESGTAILTQILGYGGDKEELNIHDESVFLKSYIKPLITEDPTGRYAQHLLLDNIKTAWAHLMGYLVSPGMLNCTEIVQYGKTIFYSLCDLKAENLQFFKNVKVLIELVKVPQNNQLTNLQTIRAIEKLVPINNCSRWSYNPIINQSELTKTMQTFVNLKLNRLIQIGYIDCGVTGDTLSNAKTIQCFPITKFDESGKNTFDRHVGGKFYKKKVPNSGSASTGGFFSGDLNEFY